MIKKLYKSDRAKHGAVSTSTVAEQEWFGHLHGPERKIKRKTS